MLRSLCRIVHIRYRPVVNSIVLMGMTVRKRHCPNLPGCMRIVILRYMTLCNKLSASDDLRIRRRDLARLIIFRSLAESRVWADPTRPSAESGALVGRVLIRKTSN